MKQLKRRNWIYSLPIIALKLSDFRSDQEASAVQVTVGEPDGGKELCSRVSGGGYSIGPSALGSVAFKEKEKNTHTSKQGQSSGRAVLLQT